MKHYEVRFFVDRGVKIWALVERLEAGGRLIHGFYETAAQAEAAMASQRMCDEYLSKIEVN